eukprot:TRINITY_DN2681_c0_g1_i4.p1 TRINITY_DN2681_c0_g1~~TRINITY_DN2681_c0_g1_i4.p1  ORF type:complete len:1993 (-),score=419.62 TRINITY_DN2681_c0_g1_i4:344-6322(-)
MNKLYSFSPGEAFKVLYGSIKEQGDPEVSYQVPDVDSSESAEEEDSGKNSGEASEESEETQKEVEDKKSWTSRFNNTLNKEADTKYSTLSSLFRDFSESSQLLAKTIITEMHYPNEKKSLKPLPDDKNTYLHQGISLTIVTDFQYPDGTWHYGEGARNDEKAAKSANNELKGAECILDSGLTDVLHVPIMSIVNYRGYAVLCRAQPPLGNDSLIYGSIDNGKTVFAEQPTFNHAMKKVGKLLNLYGQTINDKTIYGPLDIQGHFGKDCRFYVLNTRRLMPPELPRGDQKQSITYNLLRPAFVKRSTELLCSDGFSGFITGNSSTMINMSLMKATGTLHHEFIPHFAKSIEQVDISCEELICKLHSAGINCRHLGRVRHAIRIGSKVRKTILIECIARTIKNELREVMRNLSNSPTEEDYISAAYKYLNPIICFCQLLPTHFTKISLGVTVDTQTKLIKSLNNERTILLANRCINPQTEASFFWEIQLEKGTGLWIGLVQSNKPIHASYAKDGTRLHYSYHCTDGSLHGSNNLDLSFSPANEGDVIGVFFDSIQRHVIFTKNRQTIGSGIPVVNATFLTPAIVIFGNTSVKYNFGPKFPLFPNSFDISSYSKRASNMWTMRIKESVNKRFPHCFSEEELNSDYDLRYHINMRELTERISSLSGVVFSNRIMSYENGRSLLLYKNDIVRIEPRIQEMRLASYSTAISNLLNLKNVPILNCEAEVKILSEVALNIENYINEKSIKSSDDYYHYGLCWYELSLRHPNVTQKLACLERAHIIFSKFTDKKKLSSKWRSDPFMVLLLSSHVKVLCDIIYYEESENKSLVQKAAIFFGYLFQLNKFAVISIIETIVAQLSHMALSIESLGRYMTLAKVLWKIFSKMGLAQADCNMLLRLFHIVIVYSYAEVQRNERSSDPWATSQISMASKILKTAADLSTSDVKVYMKEMLTQRELDGLYIALFLKISIKVEMILKIICDNISNLKGTHIPSILDSTVHELNSLGVLKQEYKDKLGSLSNIMMSSISREHISYSQSDEVMPYIKATYSTNASGQTSNQLSSSSSSSSQSSGTNVVLLNNIDNESSTLSASEQFNLLRKLKSVMIQTPGWYESEPENFVLDPLGSFYFSGKEKLVVKTQFILGDLRNFGLMASAQRSGILDIISTVFTGVSNPSSQQLQQITTNEFRYLSFTTKMKIAENLAIIMDRLHNLKPTSLYLLNLSPSNIMLTPDMNIRLFDFSLSVERGQMAKSVGKPKPGLEKYFHPKLLTNSDNVKPNASFDVYSFGKILEEMVRVKGTVIYPQLNTLIDECISGSPISFADILEQDVFRRAIFYESCMGNTELADMWNLSFSVLTSEIAENFRNFISIGEVAEDDNWKESILKEIFSIKKYDRNGLGTDGQVGFGTGSGGGISEKSGDEVSDDDDPMLQLTDLRAGLRVFGSLDNPNFLNILSDVITNPGYIGCANVNTQVKPLLQPGKGVLWICLFQDVVIPVITHLPINGTTMTDVKNEILSFEQLRQPKAMMSVYKSLSITPAIAQFKDLFEKTPLVPIWMRLLTCITRADRPGIKAVLMRHSFSMDSLSVAFQYAKKHVKDVGVCNTLIKALARTKTGQMSMMFEIYPTDSINVAAWKKYATSICKKLSPENLRDLYQVALEMNHDLGLHLIADKGIRQGIDVTKQSRRIKILTLGSKQSGKSTFTKHIRVKYTNGMSHQEIEWYSNVMWDGLIRALHRCIEIGRSFYKTIVTPKTETVIESTHKLIHHHQTAGEAGISAVSDLLNSTEVTHLLAHINKLKDKGLTDYDLFCINNSNAILKPDFIPTISHILETYNHTTGVFESNITVGHLACRIVECQASPEELKLWSFALDQPDVVIYCVSLSPFISLPHCLPELNESIKNFHSLKKSIDLRSTPLVVIFCKVDTVKEAFDSGKLSNIKDYLPDFSSNTNSVDDIVEYCIGKFGSSSIQFVPVVTNLLNPDEVTHLFNSISNEEFDSIKWSKK